MSYDDFYKSKFGKFALKKEAEYISKRISGIALSVGCGTGIIEREIEKAGIKVICIEKDDEMLKIARRRIKAIKGDAAWLPFRNERFDAVFFITSLEFIRNYKKAIREAYRVLKSKGKFIAMLLNTESTYFKEKIGKGYISKNIVHLDIKKIEKEAKKYFDLKTHYFLCYNMKRNCKNLEKALYVMEGSAKNNINERVFSQ